MLQLRVGCQSHDGAPKFIRSPGLTGWARAIAMLPNTEVAMTDFRLVDKKGLKTIDGIPYCSQHIARLENAGVFPSRINLGRCRLAWYCSEVEAWIASRRT